VETSPQTLATILDLSRLVSSSLDLDVVLERLIAAASELSGADIVSVMMPDDSGEHLRVVAALGVPAAKAAEVRFRLGEGVAGWVAVHGVPAHILCAKEDPRYVHFYTPPDACLFALPLRVRDRTLGVLCLSGVQQHALFPPETVQMVEIFASHAAIAIDNAAAVASLRYAAARERLVNLVQGEITPSQVASTARQILAELGAILNDARCALYLPEGSGELRLLAHAPDDIPAPASWRPDGPEEPLDCPLHVPVALPGAATGSLVIWPSHSHYWRRAERHLAAFAADQIALLMRNERLVRQEQRSRALSRTLSQLAAASNALVGQDSLLDFILEQLSQFLAYDSTGVFLFHDNQYARMVAGRGFRFNGLDVVLYMGPGSLTWDVLQQRRAIAIADVQLLPSWQPVPDADVIRSWIGAPLMVNDQIIGVLTIDKWTPDAFTTADVQMAELFADHVAVAINSQRLIRDAEARAVQLQVIHQASEELRAICEQGALLDEVARMLHGAFGYYQVYICLLHGDELEIAAARGRVDGADSFRTLRRYSASLGLTGWAATNGRTLLVNNVATDQRFFAHPQTPNAQAELVVPISHGERVLGVIAVQSAQSGAFGQSDVYLTEAVASLTAMSMERIRRDEELRSAQDQLARNERLRALGELASGVAHDFNNLLASILGHTQLLLADAPDPAIAEELRVIERAALDGAATVRRLQSFAQTSKALPTEPVLLSEVVAESLALTRPRWRDGPQTRGAQITVLREIAELPPVAGDGPALRELVMNLILNAVDAMPGGGTLRLRTSLLPADRSPLGELAAELLVADTGVGMTDEVRARIFEPFFTTKGAGGTGMGLAMVYGIVQRHHGAIDVQSEPGRGTAFRVFLPARAPGAEAPAVAVVAPAAPPLQVLIVDDDDAVRRVLARHVARLGHAVAEASSGVEALSRLAQERYDLLCTDLGMPGMSGWDLIAAARRADETLATVLITGWGDQIDQETARANGADALIAKPFNTERIRQVFDELRPRAAGEEKPGGN
jgi:signal transduction histidine kinase/ActR/RegA family two-component response regulator